MCSFDPSARPIERSHSWTRLRLMMNWEWKELTFGICLPYKEYVPFGCCHYPTFQASKALVESWIFWDYVDKAWHRVRTLALAQQLHTLLQNWQDGKGKGLSMNTVLTKRIFLHFFFLHNSCILRTTLWNTCICFNIRMDLSLGWMPDCQPHDQNYEYLKLLYVQNSSFTIIPITLKWFIS